MNLKLFALHEAAAASRIQKAARQYLRQLEARDAAALEAELPADPAFARHAAVLAAWAALGGGERAAAVARETVVKEAAQRARGASLEASEELTTLLLDRSPSRADVRPSASALPCDCNSLHR